MASKVALNNVGHQALVAFPGPVDLALAYENRAFDNPFDGYGVLGLMDSYAMLFPGGDTRNKPVYYFRHYDVAKNEYRFGDFMVLGDSVLEPQKGVLHEGQGPIKDGVIERYHLVSQDPMTFVYGSEEPKVEYRFEHDRIRIVEGDFFDVVATPFPVAIYDHNSVYDNTNCIFQPLLYMGTLDGEPVLGLGEIERMWFNRQIRGFDAVPMGYIAISGIGVRPDGRRESTLISTSINPTGKTFAYFWRDGEEPVISSEVTIEAEWRHLPYVDDGTCVFEDAVVEFAGKKVHFHGRWGTKGFQPRPRIERHGQSQAIGSWYEGDEPYEHRLYCGFAESMEAYDSVLKELGFDVID